MSARVRRWASWTAVAIIASIVCALLGLWQFSRYEGKAHTIALVEANYQADPRTLDEVLTGAGFDGAAEWRPVAVHGEYVGAPVILPQRGVLGTAGDHVLHLFVTTDERTIIIDRGWYPVGHAPPDLTAPAGRVHVVGRARPTEPPSTRGVRDHQVFAVDPAQVIEAQGPVPTPQVQASVYLMADDGAPGQGQLRSFPRPVADLGNHLSYAFQWWIFAAGAFVGLGVVIRRDLKAEHDPGARPKRVSRDIAEEDALIDAQLEP